MEAEPTEEIQRAVRRARTVCAGLVGLLGVVVLSGWAFGWDHLIRVSPRWVSMKPLTAASLAAVGAGAALSGWSDRRRGRPAARAAGIATVLIAVVSTAEHLIDRTFLGFDRVLFPGRLGLEHESGRIEPLTALALLLLGVGVMAAAGSGRTSAAVPFVAGAAGVVGYVGALGYLYGVSSLYPVGAYEQMALHTAVGVVVASLALLLAVPERSPVAMFCDRGAAGRLTRRLAPAVLVGMPVMGWMVLSGERAELFDPPLGEALLVMTLVAVFGALNWSAGRTILTSEEELVRTNLALEDRVAERTAALAADAETAVLVGAAARAAATATDVAAAVTAFGAVVRSGVPVDGVSLAIHHGGGVVEVAGAWRPAGHPSAAGSRLTLGDDPHWESLREDRTVAVADTTALEGRRLDQALTGREVRSYVTVPVVAGGEVRALTTFWASRPGAFPPELVARCERLARAAAGPFNILVLLDREREAARRLRELDALKNEFVAIVAHDLRSPLGVISGFARVVRDDWAKLSDDERCRLLDRILTRTDRLAALVGDVLEVARIESGSVEYQATPFDVVELVRRTVADITTPAGRAWELTAPVDLPLAVGDEPGTWRVLTNLLSNAVKFSPPDAPITVDVSAAAGEVRVTVTDRGPGFAPEDHDRLFQKFSRLGGRGQGPEPEGTGLGLYISRKLIEGQHGRIWAASIPGQGATFGFTLPAVSSEMAVPAGKAPATARPPGRP